MLVKIIAAVVLILFFFILSRAGMKMIGEENSLAKFFPIGSTVLVSFILGLMFLGE